ncbi:MAG TPA: thioredoxin family protein [Streptomyces sp.]|nr:thioredoxin family protein [Streptomyces sp.]
MNIELLYFAGCPNWHLAQERLGEALAAVGRPGLEVSLRAVETDEEAQALRFPGSPTIRVNGHDPFPSTGQSYGVTCRVYATPNGLSGAPTVDQLVQALSSDP